MSLGRGRGGKARGKRRGGEEQATSRRPITEKSRLKLCDYAPTCSKKDSCPRAHNDEELTLWNDTLRETIREYSEKFKLKLCRNIDEICENGLSCTHAHSQEELDSWNKSLSCRESSGKLLEMCRNKNKDCSFGDSCRYAHNSKELQTWINEHEAKYLKFSKSKPEMCTFTVNPPTCKLGVNCPYAHTKNEKDKLIQFLTEYDSSHPRPVPRKGKLLPYTLCKNSTIERKNIDGVCIYGSRCPQAHSEEELKCWEEQRKETLQVYHDADMDIKDTSFLYGSLEECSGNTSVEENDAIRDPFLVSLEDYQHHFGHQLSCALNLFITAAQNDIPDELGGYISHDRMKIDISTSEGQECASMFDLQYQLGFMQRNAKALSEYVGMEELDFADVALNLLEVRNSLAHGLHQKETYEEKSEIIVSYFRTVIAFMKKIKDKLQSESFNACSLKLLKVENNLAEFLLYQAKIKSNVEEMSKMNKQQKTMKAKDTLQQLLQLVEEEEKEEDGNSVTVFVITCLNARLKKLPQHQVEASKSI